MRLFQIVLTLKNAITHYSNISDKPVWHWKNCNGRGKTFSFLLFVFCLFLGKVRQAGNVWSQSVCGITSFRLSLSLWLLSVVLVFDFFPLCCYDNVVTTSTPDQSHTHTVSACAVIGRTCPAQTCNDIARFPMRNDIILKGDCVSVCVFSIYSIFMGLATISLFYTQRCTYTPLLCCRERASHQLSFIRMEIKSVSLGLRRRTHIIPHQLNMIAQSMFAYSHQSMMTVSMRNG